MRRHSDQTWMLQKSRCAAGHPLSLCSTSVCVTNCYGACILLIQIMCIELLGGLHPEVRYPCGCQELRLHTLQVAACEQELDTCQKRLAARESEVREVKGLLQSSLQPRLAGDPVPKLISLTCAAADCGPVAEAQALRMQAAYPGSAQPAYPVASSIARADPSLSMWQGQQARDIAADELHSPAAAQQQPRADPKGTRGAAGNERLEHHSAQPESSSPRKRSTAKKAAVASSGSPTVQRRRPSPVRIDVHSSDRENLVSPSEQATPFGQKQAHGKVHWRAQTSASPFNGGQLGSRRGSLYSAPSTPLSPTNASMAPTRRLPQPERLESGAQIQVCAPMHLCSSHCCCAVGNSMECRQ